MANWKDRVSILDTITREYLQELGWPPRLPVGATGEIQRRAKKPIAEVNRVPVRPNHARGSVIRVRRMHAQE